MTLESPAMRSAGMTLKQLHLEQTDPSISRPARGRNLSLQKIAKSKWCKLLVKWQEMLRRW